MKKSQARVLANLVSKKPIFLHTKLSTTAKTNGNTNSIVFSSNMVGLNKNINRNTPQFQTIRTMNTDTNIEPFEEPENDIDEYAEHNPDSGIPCTYIEFPGNEKLPPITKPFSFIGFGDTMRPTYDKVEVQQQLSDYFTAGGRVIRIHHGHEAAIFEELVNQSIFQSLDPDHLTTILPISIIEAMTGRPARTAPPEPLVFEEELFKQNMKDKCPHQVPFRSGYAFEKVIHDLSLNIDEFNVDKHLDLKFNKYDSSEYTPSFLLEDGVEPKKNLYSKIGQPAGRYMGDRINDKINQITSHLTSEHVDLIMLDELDFIQTTSYSELIHSIMEAFLQFELAVIDGKTRGYGISSSLLNRTTSDPFFLSMQKLIIISNFAAELARMCRGIPTKDPDFHPQQWKLVESLANDTAHYTSLPDPHLTRDYIQSGDIDASILKFQDKLSNLDSATYMSDVLHKRSLEEEAINQYTQSIIDGKVTPVDFDPYRSAFDEELDATLAETKAYTLAKDMAMLASSTPIAVEKVFEQRNMMLDVARRSLALDKVNEYAINNNLVTDVWRQFYEADSLNTFVHSIVTTLPLDLTYFTPQQIEEHSQHLANIVLSFKAKNIFPKQAIAIASTFFDTLGVSRANVYLNQYAEFVAMRDNIKASLDPDTIQPNYEAILNAPQLTRNRAFLDPDYIPRFLRNTRDSQLLAFETNFNIFSSDLVRTKMYPAPSNSGSTGLLTPHDYALSQGLIMMTNNTHFSILDRNFVRLESVAPSNPTELKTLINEASTAGSYLRTMERAYPYMARDCGEINLPPAFAMWPASFFLSRADKMVNHEMFEMVTVKELVPAALGALRELQNIPTMAEYVKQFRTALTRFQNAESIALAQTLAPILLIIDEFLDDTCPKLRDLPSLESKLLAISLAFEFDSVSVLQADSFIPIVEWHEIERNNITISHDHNSGEIEYPLLPSCIPSKEEAHAILDAVNLQLKSQLTLRVKELTSLCIEEIVLKARTEPPVPSDIDLFTSGEKSVRDESVLNNNDENLKKLMKFQSRHHLFMLNMNH